MEISRKHLVLDAWNHGQTDGRTDRNSDRGVQKVASGAYLVGGRGLIEVEESSKIAKKNRRIRTGEDKASSCSVVTSGPAKLLGMADRTAHSRRSVQKLWHIHLAMLIGTEGSKLITKLAAALW